MSSYQSSTREQHIDILDLDQLARDAAEVIPKPSIGCGADG